MARLEHVQVEAMDPHRFVSVLSPGEYEALRGLIRQGARESHGRVIWNVNSTAKRWRGRRDAAPAARVLRGAGVDARWAVISGDPEFFAITKRLHNRLHGLRRRRRPLGEAELPSTSGAAANAAELVAARCAARRRAPSRSADGRLVPRPAGDGRDGDLALTRRPRPAQRPRARSLELPAPLREPAARLVFSRAGFVWEGLAARSDHRDPTLDRRVLAQERRTGARTVSGDPRRRRHPRPPRDRRTDVHSSDGTTGRVHRRADTLEEQPLTPADRVVMQVSRWDRLKDPLGVLVPSPGMSRGTIRRICCMAGP